MVLQVSEETSYIHFPFFGVKSRIPYKGKRKCVCGARSGDYHRSGCRKELCPECFKRLKKCGCRDKIKSNDVERGNS